MSRAFPIHHPERAYTRNGLFALELLDPVTLSRVTDGVRVVGEGLPKPDPSINASGLFVWRGEDASALVKVTIDPQRQPFDRVELPRADLNLPPTSTPPVTTIELPLRLDYPFTAGTTSARGTLIEDRVLPNATPTPVLDATVRLRWLDDDGITWHDATSASLTITKGDFVVVLRLAPNELPLVDANGALTVRLLASRDGNPRQSGDFKLPQGRVADPTTLNTLIFAWDELQP